MENSEFSPLNEVNTLQQRLSAHSLPFLSALLGCSLKEAWECPLTFQVFDDFEERRDPRLAKTFQGSLASLAEELDLRNAAGAGVFMAVNETDGTGRSKKHIQALRAWWADLDAKDASVAFTHEALLLPPSILICSGHGVHAYWRAAEPYSCAGDQERQKAHELELKCIQVALSHLGADPTVCEVARVRRLPGFWNRKREPKVLVELIEAKAVNYTPDQIRATFPESRSNFPSHIPERHRPISVDEKSKRSRAYAEVLAREAPAIAGALGHRTTLQVAIKLACGFDLSEDEAFGLLLECYNPVCRPPWSEVELRRKVQEALRMCTDRGWLLNINTATAVRKKDTTNASVPRVEEDSNWPPVPEQYTAEIADLTRPCFPPFRLDRDGLWFVPKGKLDEDGTEGFVKPQKVCGPFGVLAETRDVRASSWGLRLRWRDPDGGYHEETIPRELALAEGAELARILIRRGLRVAPDESCRKKLVGYLASVKVKARARSVERVGWHGSVFVLPDGAYGETEAGESVYLALELEHAFRVCGTLDEWKREVGAHAQDNSRLTFALACAFAAPLLGRLGMESGGFHFYGQSSKGKTTCVEAAGSVWGGPIFRETWRATSNGLEAIALAHNDCLLILDEQGQALPKEAGEVAYLLANGLDKVRARKSLDARPRRRWQTLFISTGEVTLSDKMREEGRAPKSGQDVRMVDIPVNPDGLDQAFECWSGFESSKELADHLRVATRQHFGVAARAFLVNLCRMTTKEILTLEMRKVSWARAHLPRGADSQVARVVDRFALVAVAGELAQEWGVVPWTAGNASSSTEICLRAWLVQRGGLGAGENERGVAAVLGFIQRHGTSRFAEWENPLERVVNSAGFRRRVGHDQTDYLFHAEGWNDACEGFQPREVARACATVGLLVSVMESGRIRFQKNVKVPGRGTERFYVISGRGLDVFRARQAEVEGEPAILSQE